MRAKRAAAPFELGHSAEEERRFIENARPPYTVNLAGKRIYVMAGTKYSSRGPRGDEMCVRLNEMSRGVTALVELCGTRRQWEGIVRDIQRALAQTGSRPLQA